MSDHNPVFVELALGARRARQKPRQVPMYKKAKWDSIRTDLKTIHEELIEKDKNGDLSVEDMWHIFKEGICKYIASSIPTKTIKDSMQLPWVTDHIRRLGERSKKAHQKWTQDKCKINQKEKAKALKHQHQREMWQAYWAYIEGLISLDEEEATPDQRPPKQKRLFQYIKSLKTEGSGVPSLKKDGQLITDTIGKVEVLNDQYESVFTKEPDGNIPDKGPSPYAKMEDPFITIPGVEKLLRNIKPNKASGPDAIAARVMQETATDLAPELTLIFNRSISQGKLPSDWKKANVVPVYKKGSKYIPANYRPVSLMCISCKILEHIIVSNVMGHLDNNAILHNNQHGF